MQQYTIAYDSPNVKYSGNIKIYTVTAFTQAQLDSSIVLCYSELFNSWIPVPGYNIASKTTSFIAIDVFDGNLEIRRGELNAAGQVVKQDQSDNFRVIIIPATKITPLSLHGPDLNDYSAVKAYYHLSD